MILMLGLVLGQCYKDKLANFHIIELGRLLKMMMKID